MTCRTLPVLLVAAFADALALGREQEPVRLRSSPPEIHSSWDDLLAGIENRDQWLAHKEVLRQRFLDLIRDGRKPEKPPLDLREHEAVEVDGVYVRKLISFKHIRPGLLEGRLPPIDFHEIMALIAPRAYLDVSALNDGDGKTQRQRALVLMKVMDAVSRNLSLSRGRRRSG